MTDAITDTKKTKIIFIVEDDFKRKIDEAAKEHQMSRSVFIRFVLGHFISVSPYTTSTFYPECSE